MSRAAPSFAIRLAAVLVGVLGLAMVGLGIALFVPALSGGPSSQYGLITGPALALAGLPAIVAALMLWREGRLWWLAATWSGAGLVLGAWNILNDLSQPPGPVIGDWLFFGAYAAALAALLNARRR
jgi:hypothetical protein